MKKTITLYILLMLHGLCEAQPGTPDMSFGTAGKVISETYDGEGYAVAIQPDGKIIEGGNGSFYNADSVFLAGFLVVRYNADGTIDESFGDHGRAINNYGELVRRQIISLALQPDGKIIAAGIYNTSTAVLRFNANGTIDESFGTGGININLFSGAVDIVTDMALLPDGRMVVTGDLENGSDNDNRRSFIACYTTNGQLDPGFGKAGITRINYYRRRNMNMQSFTIFLSHLRQLHPPTGAWWTDHIRHKKIQYKCSRSPAEVTPEWRNRPGMSP